jgi:hypothetical protein
MTLTPEISVDLALDIRMSSAADVSRVYQAGVKDLADGGGIVEPEGSKY